MLNNRYMIVKRCNVLRNTHQCCLQDICWISWVNIVKQSILLSSLFIWHVSNDGLFRERFHDAVSTNMLSGPRNRHIGLPRTMPIDGLFDGRSTDVILQACWIGWPTANDIDRWAVSRTIHRCSPSSMLNRLSNRRHLGRYRPYWERCLSMGCLTNDPSMQYYRCRSSCFELLLHVV